MRRLLLIPLLGLSLSVFAGETLRVGQKVLTVGDPAAYAIQLLGTPAYKEPIENTYGAFRGERWQYPRDHDRVITVTIFAGKVSNIEDRHN
ncbi:MAG TPA: DUF2845 domain-containing protein [Rhodanobacter sp.]